MQGTATHCTTLHQTGTQSNTRQQTATRGIALQHTTPHCNTLQHTPQHCTILQHTATHCIALQHNAAHCNTPFFWCSTLTAAHCNTLQHTATHCNTLQHTTPHCITLCFLTSNTDCNTLQRIPHTGWWRPIRCLIYTCHFPPKALQSMALVWKKTCNLRHPVDLRHPVCRRCFYWQGHAKCAAFPSFHGDSLSRWIPHFVSPNWYYAYIYIHIYICTYIQIVQRYYLHICSNWFVCAHILIGLCLRIRLDIDRL